MKTSDSIAKIAPAFLIAQKNIGAAVKDQKNPFFKSTYADLGSVMEACKEALNKNGIAVLQPVGMEGEKTYVETILLHESGEYISDRMIVLLEKATPQGQGSAITYARRYALQSMCFIPAEDDDANQAEKSQKLNQSNSHDKQQSSVQPTTPAPASRELFAKGKEKGLWSNSKGFYIFASAELGILISADSKLSAEQRVQLNKAIDGEQPIQAAS
jgi:ERF superfamily